MPKKRFNAEQIVTLLRQIEVSMAAGQTCADGVPGCRHIAAELRNELLNGEIFYSLKEGQIVIEQWRKHYNTVRPHSSLGYRPPAPQTMNPFLTPLDQAAQMQ
jgi:transposase InsO family protein